MADEVQHRDNCELDNPMIDADEHREEKVNFDMRLQYYEVLKKIMTATSLAAFEGDMTGYFRGLQQQYIKICAYINPEKAKQIEEKLQRAKRKLQTVGVVRNGAQRSYLFGAEELLNEIDLLIHESAKAIYLPIGGEQSDDVDWEKIARDS